MKKRADIVRLEHEHVYEEVRLATIMLDSGGGVERKSSHDYG
jgi:hypothetical protein